MELQFYLILHQFNTYFNKKKFIKTGIQKLILCIILNKVNYISQTHYYTIVENLILGVLCLQLHKTVFLKPIGSKRDT